MTIEPPATALTAAIERRPDRVRILDLTLPVDPQPGPLTPDLAGFGHFTPDADTLALLHFVASELALRHPVMLEGPTSTAKTSLVLFLAALQQQECHRINLHEVLDPGELMGKWVPGAGSSWEFAEGPLPTAMTAGRWLLLDEVNLAGPGVLDRVLSAAERAPMLAITEGQYQLIGGRGGRAVHDGFRLLATLNPAYDPGRQVLSPAFRSRFVGRLHVPAVDEGGYRAMLRFNVLGEAPVVSHAGRSYQGIDPPIAARPAYEELAGLPHIDELLDRLALLYAKLGVLLDERGTGRAVGPRREDPVAFTRRDLLAMLDRLLARRRRDGPRADLRPMLTDVLETTFLSGLARHDDRDAVADLLSALGLHRVRWVALGATTTSRRDGRRPTLEPAQCWQSVSGDLAVTGAEAAYCIALQEGETIEFSTSPHAGHGCADFDTYLRLLDPHGAEVAADDDSGDRLTSWLRHSVAESGVHEVRVSGSLPTQVGRFRLAWRATTHAPARLEKLVAEPDRVRTVLVDGADTEFELDAAVSGLVTLTCEAPGYAGMGPVARLAVLHPDGSQADSHAEEEDDDPFEEEDDDPGDTQETAAFVVAGSPRRLVVERVAHGAALVGYQVQPMAAPRVPAVRQWEMIDLELPAELRLAAVPLDLAPGPWCFAIGMHGGYAPNGYSLELYSRATGRRLAHGRGGAVALSHDAPAPGDAVALVVRGTTAACRGAARVACFGGEMLPQPMDLDESWTSLCFELPPRRAASFTLPATQAIELRAVPQTQRSPQCLSLKLLDAQGETLGVALCGRDGEMAAIHSRLEPGEYQVVVERLGNWRGEAVLSGRTARAGQEPEPERIDLWPEEQWQSFSFRLSPGRNVAMADFTGHTGDTLVVSTSHRDGAHCPIALCTTLQQLDGSDTVPLDEWIATPGDDLVMRFELGRERRYRLEFSAADPFSLGAATLAYRLERRPRQSTVT